MLTAVILCDKMKKMMNVNDDDGRDQYGSYS